MLNGINNKCKTCNGECKQYKQIKVIYCPNYVNIGWQNENSGTLQAQENAPEARS